MMGYEMDRPTSMNSGVIRVLVLPCSPGKGWESERLETPTLPHPGELLRKESSMSQQQYWSTVGQWEMEEYEDYWQKCYEEGLSLGMNEDDARAFASEKAQDCYAYLDDIYHDMQKENMK